MARDIDVLPDPSPANAERIPHAATGRHTQIRHPFAVAVVARHERLRRGDGVAGDPQTIGPDQVARL